MKTSVSHPACHHAGSHHGQGVFWGGKDAASCLCVGIADVGKSPVPWGVPQAGKKKKELYCFLLPQNSLSWAQKGGDVMPAQH